jgi:hypothetical protein
MAVTAIGSKQRAVGLEGEYREAAIRLLTGLLGPYNRTCAGEVRLKVSNPSNPIGGLMAWRNAEQIVDRLRDGKALTFTPCVVVDAGEFPNSPDHYRYGLLTPQPQAARTFSHMNDFMRWASQLQRAR